MTVRKIFIDIGHLALPHGVHPTTLGELLPYLSRYICTCGYRTENRNTWKSHLNRGRARREDHFRANAPRAAER